MLVFSLSYNVSVRTGRHASSGRAPAWQAQGPEINPYVPKKRKKKNIKVRMITMLSA
jgi:hypothetical protein